MKEVTVYRNGAYNAEEVIGLEHDSIDTISDAKVIKVTELFIAHTEWPNFSNEEINELHFVIVDGVAYPFDLPFYEGDADEGEDEQLYPENWEDVIGLIEGFGR